MKIKIDIKNKVQKQRYSLTLMFSLLILGILVTAITLAAIASWLLVRFNVITSVDESSNPKVFASLMVITSVIMGIVIAFFAVRIPLKPINKLINQLNSLSNGDYNVKLEFSPSLDKIHSFKELSNSFNKLSDELKNTEMLRSDFINNFSHEFKTPIVSILGFARLLKKENLTEDERAQYVNAIEKESLRLSSMATNVLNLTKVENQTILANISRFNLSEQIRASLLLLESKWSKKDPELNIDFGEYEIEANEELLEQVWINLLDNAIKFTQNHGVISLNIVENADYIIVSVGNTGTDIPPDSLDKIWRKFYQADESHASDGNGIGLAIVKRIVDLHNGDVTVKSMDGFTEFTVILPKNQ